MSYPKGTIPLREAVAKLDKNLGSRLEVLWQTAEREVHSRLSSDDGQLRGKEHSVAVEQHLTGLIPDDWKKCAKKSNCPWNGDKQLGALSLFCLSAAAALHDAGRMPGVARPGEDHGEASADWINDNGELLSLATAEARAIADICRPHNHGRIRDLGSHPRTVGPNALDAFLLASLLLLGDELHDYEGRLLKAAPSIANNIPRGQTMGFSIEGDTIYLDVVLEETEQIAVLRNRLEWINQDKLSQAAPILTNNGLPGRVSHKVDTSRQVRKQKDEAEKNRGFLGHDNFGEKDIAWFKGRDKEIKTLYNQVFLGGGVSLLRGDSGVGKTSLICAGLIPELNDHQIPVAYVRLDRLDVIGSFRRALWGQLMPAGSEQSEADLLRFLETIACEHSGKTVVVILDQFEDAARVLSAIPIEFAHSLSRIHAWYIPNMHVLLAYRSDAQALLDQFLVEVKGAGQSLLELPIFPLTREAAEEALRAGFQRAGILVSAEYTDGSDVMQVLLNDLIAESRAFSGGEGVYPPYLQMVGLTLMQLMQRSNEKILTKTVYQQSGGVTKMVADYLLNRLKSLGEMRQDAERILFHLSSGTGRGIALSAEEISAQAGLSPERTQEVISRLTSERMLRTVG